MPYATLRYEVSEAGVATIALDQPDTRNALSDELLDELIAALQSAARRRLVRCVVLDLDPRPGLLGGGQPGGFAADVPLVHKHFATERFPSVFRLLGELGKPSLCAANGHVLAGSLGIALACDLIIAKQGARFGTPEINVGVFPFMIMALIYRNVGRKKTNELLLLGEQISRRGGRADRIVNRVVAAEEFDGAVASGRASSPARSPVMMRLGKNAMFRQQDMAFDDAIEFLRSQLTVAFSTEDIQEGVEAFFEKRARVEGTLKIGRKDRTERGMQWQRSPYRRRHRRVSERGEGGRSCRQAGARARRDGPRRDQLQGHPPPARGWRPPAGLAVGEQFSDNEIREEAERIVARSRRPAGLDRRRGEDPRLQRRPGARR